jgi:UDP-N-acetylmuramate--alanine ligase
MFERFKVIHFVGIGGIGMSGIAEVLHNLGYEITGSDLKESQTTERLRGLGITIHIGHRARNINGAHLVVVSSAVSSRNPEVAGAHRKNIPVIPRAEMLAELGRLKYSVLVAGSHGKTTTTSLVATLLAHAGFDPTVVIGGKLKALGTNARLGRGEFMVAEADESDGSFLKLIPTIAVVTNVDREHMDYFKTMDSLKEAFLSFMNRVPFYGLAILCADDPVVRELLPSVHRKVMTYGLSRDADLRARKVRAGFMAMSFEVLSKEKSLGTVTVPVAGEHNVLNSLAAIGVALALNIGEDLVREAMESFEGIGRRLEFKGEERGVRVYDDYGHHPTEIRATLRAAKECMKGKRLVVVFQPHRYSRTKEHAEEFAASFGDADRVMVMDIYPAGEKPVKGVSGEALSAAMKYKGVSYAPGRKEAAQQAVDAVRRGDMVLTLGAGDVWKVGEAILGLLKRG